MRVLQINAVYGHRSTGVITKNISHICKENGIESYIAFPKGAGSIDNNTIEIGTDLDHKLHAILTRVAGKQAYFSKYATRRLISQLRKLKPDVVHLHNLHSNYINLNMLLRYLAEKNIATVITMHDCWYFTGGCFHYTAVGCNKWKFGCGRCPKKKLDSPAYLCDASASILKDRSRFLNTIPRLVLVGCSEWIAEECKKSILRNKDIRFIHNGFDLSIFCPTESNWRKWLGLENKFVIIGPANKWLSPVNKETYEYFIKNMTEDMVLVLFGGADVNQKEVSNVKQIGFIKDPNEMAKIYSMADVMVNCSREDTLSSINIECQACGTPVVTYDATGNKETVDGKSGFAVETGDVRLLFEKTLLSKNIGKSNLTKNCVNWVISNFDKNISYKKYLGLYRELC